MSTKVKIVKKGDLIKVIANTGGHNYTIGDVYKVYDISSGTTPTIRCMKANNTVGNNLYFDDYELTGSDRKYYNAQIAELESKIENTKSIIAWMDETRAKEYNENEHRVWKALTAMEDSNMSKLDRMRTIVALLK
jgi:hypothetical protein